MSVPHAAAGGNPGREATDPPVTVSSIDLNLPVETISGDAPPPGRPSPPQAVAGHPIPPKPYPDRPDLDAAWARFFAERPDRRAWVDKDSPAEQQVTYERICRHYVLQRCPMFAALHQLLADVRQLRLRAAALTDAYSPLAAAQVLARSGLRVPNDKWRDDMSWSADSFKDAHTLCVRLARTLARYASAFEEEIGREPPKGVAS